MKKLILLMVVMIMFVVAFTGCTQNTVEPETTETPSVSPAAVNLKVKVNIEGIISEIDGNRIKLDNGKWVVITGDTKFEDDPDNGVEAVNNKFAVGNFVQGFTEGDSEGKEVTAYCIYKNEAK